MNIWRHYFILALWAIGILTEIVLLILAIKTLAKDARRSKFQKMLKYLEFLILPILGPLGYLVTVRRERSKDKDEVKAG